MTDLFSREEIKRSIESLIECVKNQDFFYSRDLQIILDFFLGKQDVDKYCQVTILSWEIRFKSLLDNGKNSKEDNEIIFSIMYRFLREVMLNGMVDDREGSALSEILLKYNPVPQGAEFSKRTVDSLNYSNNEFPIVIYAKQTRKIAHLVYEQDVLDKKIEKRIKRYDDESVRLSSLEEKISGLKSEYNFVALSHAFSSMETIKKGERKVLVVCMVLVQFFMLSIPAFVFCKFSTSLETDDFGKMLLHFSPIVTIELMLIYLFRVFLQQFNNVKTVLLQIELRRNICQFIEGYADYAKELKEKNPVSLEKFEALVFSGLISNQNQLPSSFDGVEQLAKLASAIRGK